MSTKRMNILECIEVIADKAENSQLSESFAYSGGYPFSISGDIRSVPS